MHTIKITPNLLFEYQCTSGRFIRLPNRIETFSPNWNALATTAAAAAASTATKSSSRRLRLLFLKTELSTSVGLIQRDRCKTITL